MTEFWILAAATTETVIQAPTALQTYGPAGAIIIAMGGWKGVAQGILWLQGRTGPRSGKYVPKTECELLCKKNDQMTAILVKSIDKLEVAVTRLHDRIDHHGDEHKG